MRSSLRGACFVVAFVAPAWIALAAMPIGCGGEDVVVARAEPRADATDSDARADAGEAGSPCSGDHAHWWCDGDGAPNPCHDDGSAGTMCFGDSDGDGGGDAHTRPPSMEGGFGQPCSSNDDCPSGPSTFCAKPSCGAPQGECQLRPLFCDDDAEDAGGSVCGCDGINYWNDCLRKRDGIASNTGSQCSGYFVTCGGSPPKLCPGPDSVCFIQDMLEPSGECSGSTDGVCWVPPDVCPEDAGRTDWQGCGDPMHDCVDLCVAIQSGKPHMRAGSACP